MATMYYRPYTSQPIKDGEFPPYNAMETILPEYQYIFVDGQDNRDAGKRRKPGSAPGKNNDPEDIDKTSMALLDHQMKELEDYRTAVRKMGQDILSLRGQIKELEIANSKLRRERANYSDATKLMLDSAELDGLSKPEICSRYVAIKQKLASQTAEMKSYKEKVQKLQNDLIKKNDKEKEMIKLNHAHSSQQEIIQKLQEKTKKAKKMEDALREQEKVIERLEKVLDRKFKDKNSKENFHHADANEALMAENRRLRRDIEELKELSQSKNPEEDFEKMELYQALDKAEGRIMSLEKQLAENSRQWGKERADLMIKLNEAEHGFNRHSQMVLHDYPLRAPDPLYKYPDKESRRYSKAPQRYGSPKLEPLYYK